LKRENYLDSLTIVSLPRIQQKIAISLLSLNKGSAEEISRDIKADEQKTIRALENLVENEFIVKKPAKNSVYYCLKE